MSTIHTDYQPFGEAEIPQDGFSQFQKLLKRLEASIPIFDETIEDVPNAALLVARMFTSHGLNDDKLLKAPKNSVPHIVKGMFGHVDENYVYLINLTWGKIPRPE